MEDKGRIAYSVGIENNKLRSDATESKRILSGIGDTAVKEGQKMDDAFKKVGTAIAGAMSAAAVSAFAKQIISVRAEIQSLEISFRTLLGSATKADALFGELRKFAVQTPLMLKDLASGAQTMLGFGIAGDEVMPILKAIGDISMGDSQKLQSLTLAFSQATAAGKLMGQDFLQLVSAGFNPLNQISETTGKSIATLKEEMSEGKITADMLKQAFMDATAEGGKFHGMLEAQSKGINGAISNLQGAIDDLFNDIGEKVEAPFVSATNAAGALVKNYKKLGKVIAEVVAAFGVYKAAVITLSAIEKARYIATLAHMAGMTKMQILTDILTKKTAALHALMAKNPYMLAAAAVATLALGIYKLATYETQAEEAQRKLNDAVKECDKSIASERAQIDTLFAKLKAAKEGTEEYETARKNIINQYGDYLRGLNDEISTLKDVEGAYNAITIAARESARARAEQAYIASASEDYGEKTADAREELREALDKHYGDQKGSDGIKLSESYFWKIVPVLEGREELTEEIQKMLEPLNRGVYVGGQTNTGFGAEVHTTNDAMNAIKKAQDAKKIYDDVLKEAEVRFADDPETRKRRVENEKKTAEEAKKAKDEAKKQAEADARKKEAEKEREAAAKQAEKDAKEAARQEEKRQKEQAAEEEARKKAASEAEDYMNEYLAKYGDFETKKKAIEAKYTKAKNNAQSEGEKKLLQKEMEEELASLDYEKLKGEIDWQKVFGNLDEVSKGTLEDLKARLIKFVNESKGISIQAKKDIVEAITGIDKELSQRSPFKNFGDSMNNLKGTTIELKKVQDEYNKALEEGTEAEKEAAKEELNRARDANREAKSKATQALHDATAEARKYQDAVNSAMGMIESFGIKPPQWMNDFIGGFDKMLGGLEKIDLMKPMTILTGAMDAASGLVQSVFSIGGLIDWKGSNAKEVKDTIDRLTDRNEALQVSIEDLTDEIKNSRGMKSVDAYRMAHKNQEEMNKNYLEMAKAQAGYHNNHHSWQNYWKGFSPEQMAWIKANISADFTGDLFSLSPEEMKKLRANVEIWQQIQNTGKGGYGERLTEQLDQYIEQAGKLEELTDNLYAGLTGITFDGMYDSFIDSLMDMEYSAEDSAKKISGYFMKSMLSNKIGELYGEKLKSWWEKFGLAMKNDGTLDEGERNALMDEYQQYVEEALKLRDQLASATGYDKYFNEDEAREASQRGLASASQESVEELSGRATAIQGHTYSIMENTKLLVQNTNEILASVMNIDRSTGSIDDRMASIESNVKDLKDTMNDIALKGVKMK